MSKQDKRSRYTVPLEGAGCDPRPPYLVDGIFLTGTSFPNLPLFSINHLVASHEDKQKAFLTYWSSHPLTSGDENHHQQPPHEQGEPLNAHPPCPCRGISDIPQGNTIKCSETGRVRQRHHPGEIYHHLCGEKDVEEARAYFSPRGGRPHFPLCGPGFQVRGLDASRMRILHDYRQGEEAEFQFHTRDGKARP